MIAEEDYNVRTLTQLEALCLREIPTVENWAKTRMSEHVVRHVNNKMYPEEMCDKIREEYPEWFL